MTTIGIQPLKSLYTNKALKRRWWVDPSVAYLYRRDADVEIISNLSHKLEEHVIGQIAQKVNKHCMSKAYNKLQQETQAYIKFSHHNLVIVFYEYLEQLCYTKPNSQDSLAKSSINLLLFTIGLCRMNTSNIHISSSMYYIEVQKYLVNVEVRIYMYKLYSIYAPPMYANICEIGCTF